MITHIRGNLFTVPGLDALAQGVNCRGVMGAGIALQFRRQWPRMFEHYRARCLAGRLRPGEVHAYLLPDGRWCLNLATQLDPGPCATLAAVDLCLGHMLSTAALRGVRRIGMPKIAAGLGGLQWPDVLALLEEHDHLGVEIVVASLD